MIRRQAALGCVMLAWLARPGAAPAHDLGVARAMLEELPGARYVLEVETTRDLASCSPRRSCRRDARASGARASRIWRVLRYEFACAREPLTARTCCACPGSARA